MTSEMIRNKEYDDLLLELMHLKRTDYDRFMRKLYDAISGEFKGALNNTDSTSDKEKALSTMIQYFQDREEYEKCAILKKMADSLNA